MRSGVSRQMTSSARARTRSSPAGVAIGSAHMSRAGCRLRRLARAAYIVAPLTRPSSTTITTRPPGSASLRTGVYTARCLRSWSNWASRWLSAPPFASIASVHHVAPESSSATPGAILRAITRSKSAPSASATTRPTGTPPRGIARTSASVPRYARNAQASSEPACSRA